MDAPIKSGHDGFLWNKALIRTMSSPLPLLKSTPGDEALVPRAQFPLLQSNPGLVYLDSASSAQKPGVVIDRLTRFYSGEYANIHRGLYPLSEEASEAYDQARARV
ncbi:MAG: aminotransferase class V-fold PLP-dependent enzyme, partial [Rhodospirillaceae bacterium]|nr:aminotransferase class V-fold PLP-dependent enzyme [Rhodospirillaceae bacterium]